MTLFYFRTDHIMDMRRFVWDATLNLMNPVMRMAKVEQFSRVNVGHLLADEIKETLR